MRPGATAEDTTINNAQVILPIDYNDSNNQSYGFTGRVEHRFGNWRVDYAASYSKSDAKVIDMPHGFVNGIQFQLAENRGVALRVQTTPGQAAPTAITQLAGPDWRDIGNYDQRGFTAPSTATRLQNDQTWNLKFDLRRDFPQLRMPLELRTGANFYQLHRRKAAGHTVFTFLGPDGRAGSGDELINASMFFSTETRPT